MRQSAQIGVKMKMKKITAMLLTLTLGTTMLFAGCGSKDETPKAEGGDVTQTTEQGVEEEAPTDQAGGEKIKISFLNGFTGGDGGFMRKITDGFNQSQDKYEVVESQEKDHYLKFKSSNYDLVVMHGDRIKTYVEDEMIQEVSAIYEKAGLTSADFVEAGNNIVTIDGKVYAFPLDIHPLTMFYNKDLVQEAPKTYADLIALQETLNTQGDNLFAMGIPGAGLVEYYYMALATQNGLDIQGGEFLNFATDEFADILLQLNKMIYVDKISPANLGLDGEFKTFVQDTEGGSSAQTAIALTGPWFYNAAKEKYGDKLGVAPIPVLGNEAGAYGGAHTLAVSATVTDEAVMDGIAAFLVYLYTPENLLNWADAGQTPIHNGTQELILQNAEKYPLAAANIEQIKTAKIAPQVYNVGEQMKYLNENVFNMVVSQEKLTKEQLMPELEKATKMSEQIAADK